MVPTLQVLTDSVGDIADSAQVAFFTTATTYDPPPTQSDLGDKVYALFFWGGGQCIETPLRRPIQLL
jgi:hypothetical protein